MAKLPDRMLCDLAQRFLRMQAERLATHLDSARTPNDIEDIHQVRVACRRIRAGLAFFGDCFDEELTVRWRRQLKKALRAFGPARDCDVQILFIEQTLQTLGQAMSEPNNAAGGDLPMNAKTLRAGIARLLLRLRQQRQAIQPAIVKAIQRLQHGHLMMNMHLETERLAYQVEHAEPQTPAVRFFDRAAEWVGRRREEVFGKLAALEDPQDAAGHHALRIAVKKLRYTLELCDLALDNRLNDGIKQLKKLQTLLGDLHDCDVWDAQIEAFIADETARAEAYYGHTRPIRRLMPGLRYLQIQRRLQREQVYDRATAFAAALAADDFWVWVKRSVCEEDASMVRAVRQDKDGSDGRQ